MRFGLFTTLYDCAGGARSPAELLDTLREQVTLAEALGYDATTTPSAGGRSSRTPARSYRPARRSTGSSSSRGTSWSGRRRTWPSGCRSRGR
jgi:hypothetical protein